ncbi:MAG: GNAT family N-acetyltransferase [Phycisphaerae bacterium]
MRPPLQLVRLPVDKPQPAVSFLHERSQGVMDLIAHFWERLAQTPPLQRGDLHLVVATPTGSDVVNINTPQLDAGKFSGAMLYVPKAHRADVLALDPPTAAAFAAYISHKGMEARSDNVVSGAGMNSVTPDLVSTSDSSGGTLPLTDLSSVVRGAVASMELPGDPGVGGKGAGAAGNGKVPIDFLTGHAEGIGWMVPMLLPVVHKKAPAREMVNVVMQLPEGVVSEGDGNVRAAKEADVPVLNKWRRMYKEERGILFDADLDAWVQTGRVFVYEHEKQVVAVAKFDLELPRLIEIGGVFTFPEFRKKGFGGRIVADLAGRIRAAGKTPTLQVDDQNGPALKLYEGMGWRPMGRLARVWLTG